MVGLVFVSCRSQEEALEESVEVMQLSDAAQAVIQAKREKELKRKQRKNERNLGRVEGGEASAEVRVDANAQAQHTYQTLDEAAEQGQVQVFSYTCVLLKRCDTLLSGVSIVTFGQTLQGRSSIP